MKQYRKVIHNSLNQQTLSHCYLLIGKADLLKPGYWLSSVLMSKQFDNQQLQERIENGYCLDFMLLNGEQQLIKKEDVLAVQSRFANTAIETYRHKVLMIHQCHLASPHTMNALLKMIEEPNDTSFVLTSNNAEAVLSTILSRCIVLYVDEALPEVESKPWAVNFLELVNQNITQACLVLYQQASVDMPIFSQGVLWLLVQLREKIYTMNASAIELKCFALFTWCQTQLSVSTNLLLLVDSLVAQLLEGVYES